jgi:hypothetical protein
MTTERMQQEEALRKALEDAPRRERIARRRTMLLTLVPFVAGGLWLVFSLNVVRKNYERAAAAAREAAVADTGRVRAVAAQREAEVQLRTIRHQIDSLRPQLLAIQNAVSTPGRASAVASVVAQTEKIRSTAVTAESDLRAARLARLVEALFGPSSRVRQQAYHDIGREFRNDPSAVDSLLSYAARNRANSNGIYNTVVTLKTLSRAVTRPRRDAIASFCIGVGRGRDVARTAAKCAELLTWIDTPRAESADP